MCSLTMWLIARADIEIVLITDLWPAIDTNRSIQYIKPRVREVFAGVNTYRAKAVF